MVSFELVNNLEEVALNENEFENMSDSEFFDWCKSIYHHKETNELLPHKTITFKKGERGYYSNDLNKIALIDKHEAVDEIVLGQPYVVEIIRDTNPTEQRKGAILVKIIKRAQAKDIIRNSEANEDVVQLEFVRSKKNDKEVVSSYFSKITLVDKNTSMTIEPRESVIGRVEDKGSINVFKPLLKANIWKKVSVAVNSTGEPNILKEIYNGIQKKSSDHIYASPDNLDDYETELSKLDFRVLKESVKRNLMLKMSIDAKNREFIEAIDKATEQAWKEYSEGRVLVEKVDNDGNNYKVKVNDDWSDVNGGERYNREQWNKENDWRHLIALRALEIVNEDRVFSELIMRNENIDLENINHFVPEKEQLGSAKDYKQICEIINDFRNISCKEIEIDLPHIKGKLIFEPLLLRYDDVHDGDYGLHADDSNGYSTFTVVYKLQNEKVNFTERFNNLPEHISKRIKKIVNAQINSLCYPPRTHLQYEAAEWISDYQAKKDHLRTLNLQDRFQVKKMANREYGEIMNEKLFMTENEFSNLQKELPVEEYATPDGSGGVEYFGLPVSRSQFFEKKYFSRSGLTTEIAKPGKYKYDFSNYGNEQLSYWLDSHKEYFDKLKSRREQEINESQLPKLDVSVDDEVRKRAHEAGLAFEDRCNNKCIYKVNSSILSLFVSLSDDFSRLLVTVDSINYGFDNKITNAEEVYNKIKTDNWRVSEQVKRILVNSGIDKKRVEDLRQKSGVEKVERNVELPFKGL